MNRIARHVPILTRALAGLVVVALAGGLFAGLRAAARGLPGTAGPLVAVGVTAVLFLPICAGVERAVGRLFYGRGPTPYRVLADLAALSGTTATGGGPDLAGVAEAIGRGLRARLCELTVLRPGLTDRAYTWTEDAAAPVPGEERVTLPIRQGEERIGTVAVDRGALAGLGEERRTLLADIADGLGAILQAARLGIELERQLRAALRHAEDIAVSRRQGVAEMDSERRRIERDLHDGAQHHLVSLRLALGLVEHELASGKPARARERIEQLGKQIAAAEAVLERTTSGVSSTVLAEHGLAAALRAELAGAHPPVALDLVDGRFPADAEAAVYYCCLEAVNNARKHAAGAPVTVRAWVADRKLRFSVRDEGPGFETADRDGPGRGLHNLAARVRAAGGDVTVESAPGAGTTVAGQVPIPGEGADATVESAPGAGTTVAGQVPIPGEGADATVESAPGAGTTVAGQVPIPGEGADATVERRAQLAGRRDEALRLAEALRSGAVRLPAPDRIAAQRLLGQDGAGPAARLGLPTGSDQAEVLAAGHRQLAHWRRLAGHPASTSAVRATAETLARICEDLLTAEAPAS